jgi:N-acetylmuramoyl-L-alanine amidase
MMAMAELTPDSPLATKVVPSPNHGPRKSGTQALPRPSMIILHYTGMDSGVAALQLLTNPLSEVSCHYLVWEDGRIFQLVPEAARAWHAGKSVWKGETDINSHSIGIEIVNGGHRFDLPAYPAVQIEAVKSLCLDLMQRHGISAANVLAHSDIAPERKEDPGEHFPWADFAACGIGICPDPAPIVDGPRYQAGDEGQPVRALQALLAMLGFGLDLTGVYDARMVSVVTAFQRHYRPQQIDGIADLSTMMTLKAVLQAAKGSSFSAQPEASVRN